MAINWDIRDVNNHDEVCLYLDGEEKCIKNTTRAIIFGCLATGIGEITEKNWSEWYARYKFWCQAAALGTMITAQDVKNHIGLKTNVFPKETRAKFLKKFNVDLDNFIRQAEEEIA